MAPSQKSSGSKEADSTSYHPGEGFLQVKPKALMDLSGDGKEVWLMRIPLEMDVHELNGLKMNVGKAGPDGIMGRIDLNQGSAPYEVVLDHPSLANQLYTLSCSGGSKLRPQKVHRHVSILPVVQEPAAEGTGAAAGEHPSAAFDAPGPSTSKKDKKRRKEQEPEEEAKDEAPKKEKKKKKKEKVKEEPEEDDAAAARKKEKKKDKADKKKKDKKETEAEEDGAGDKETTPESKSEKKEKKKRKGDDSLDRAEAETKADKKKKKKKDKDSGK